MTKIQEKLLKKLKEEFPHLEWLETVDSYDSCGFGAYLDESHDLLVNAADRFEHAGFSIYGSVFDTEGDFATPDFSEDGWKERVASEFEEAASTSNMKEEVRFNKIKKRILGVLNESH